MRSIKTTLLIILLASITCPSIATQTTKQLAPGVSLFQDINTTTGSELIVNAVTVDPKAPGVSVKAAIGKDIIFINDSTKGRETISSLTQRRGALVGVNADFFPFTGDPLGTCIIDGELVSEPGLHRVVVGVLKNGGIIFDNPVIDARLTLSNGFGRQIDGINRDRETNQVVVYTCTWGASTKTKFSGTEVVLTSDDLPIRVGKPMNLTVTEVRTKATNTAIPEKSIVISAGGPAAFYLKENLKPGDKITVQFNIKSANGTDWTQVDQAVGGGPWLLKDGNQFIDLATESMKSSFSTARHPRTAVGVTSDGKILIVTVDGRQSISRGISLPGLSDLMKNLGATNAINLDGGGSTTLSYRGIVVNSPSGGEQRPVADALLVFASPSATTELPNLTITGLQTEVASGQGYQLALTCGDGLQPLTQDQLNNVIWGTTNGGGFVNQQGYLTPIRLRKESIKAYYGSQLANCDVKVISGSPAKIDINFVADKQDALLAQATVKLCDVNGNPCGGKPIKLTVTGGKADVETGVTTAKGEFTAAITWDTAASARSVQATSDTLTGTALLPSAQPVPVAEN